MSANFERFLKSNFFGSSYHAWHDGAEFATLTALQGDELAQAEAMLLKALPDSRAVEGLGAIRSQQAVAPLIELLGDTSVSVEAAVALVQINGDMRGVRAAADALKNEDSQRRIKAATALRHFPIKGAIAALLDALSDPDVTVDYEVRNSLLSLNRQINKRDPSDAPGHVLNERERYDTIEAMRQMLKDGIFDDI